MEPKKNPQLELESRRPAFFMIGMLIALSTTLAAFEWTVVRSVQADTSEFSEAVFIEEDELPPITIQMPDAPAPRPPAAPSADVIEIVKNEVIIPEPTVEVVPQTIEIPTIPEIVFVPEPEPVEPEVFTIVEEMPQFRTGYDDLLKWLKRNVKYPAHARNAGIQGKVYVAFTIMEDGTAADIKLIRKVHPMLDKEALRVIKKMPGWKPGSQRGKKVRVSMTIPINFVLQS